jgi:DNA-binding NtrC family response regulator
MKHSSTSGGARILFVYEDAEVLSCTRALESARHQVSPVRGCDAAIQQIENGLQPDLVLLNLDTPRLDDLRMIEACRRIRAQQKVVVIAKVIDVSTVVQAMRWGALDYISTPQDGSELLAEVQRLLSASSNATDKPEQSFGQFEEVENHISFLAVSPAMRKIRAQVAQVAKVDIPVLLLGESGVGKEVLARLIHKLSRRSGKTMVKVN